MEDMKFHHPYSFLGPPLPLKRKQAFKSEMLLKAKMSRLSIAGDEEDDIETDTVQKEKID